LTNPEILFLSIEEKVAELKKIEMELGDMRSKNDAASKAVKEATNQKLKEEEKTAKLEQAIAELERLGEEKATKLNAVTHQLQEFVERQGLHDRRVNEVRSGELVRVSSEEILAVKVQFSPVLFVFNSTFLIVFFFLFCVSFSNRSAKKSSL